MKYSKFEEHIKKELGAAEEPVQMDALLDALKLGREPRGKRFALWMLLPFILIISVSAYAWKSLDTKSYQQESNSASLVSSDTDNTKKVLSDNDLESLEIKTEASKLALDKLNKDAETTINDLNNDFYKSDSKLNTTQNREKESVGNQELEVNYSNEKVGKSKNKLPSFDDSQSGENEVLSSYPNLNSAKIPAKNKISINNSNTDVIASSSNENKLSSEIALSVTSKLFDKPISIERSKVNVVTLGLDESNLFSRMRINCPSFDKARWHVALIPEVGLFVPNKTLGVKSVEGSEAFLERAQSESTLEGLNLGLYTMLVRDNIPFYLKAGISYSRIAEKMSLSYNYTVQDTMTGIISSTVSSNGDTITHIYGDIISETTYKGRNTQHHYIHLFDIPVSVGYTTYLAGLDIGFEAGVKINFMTRATGNLLTSSTDYTNLSLERLFKNSIGISYFGGLMIGRNFGRYGDFYLAPRFHYYQDDFSNQSNPISQKYFSVGINLGVVYNID